LASAFFRSSISSAGLFIIPSPRLAEAAGFTPLVDVSVGVGFVDIKFARRRADAAL